MPSIPTIIKKLKFKILTAVPEIIFLFVACKTGTRSADKLAFPASTQNINAIKVVFISSQIKMHIVRSEIKVITDAPFKNLTLWLWQILQAQALIILKTAATIAIIDKIIAALPDVI